MTSTALPAGIRLKLSGIADHAGARGSGAVAGQQTDHGGLDALCERSVKASLPGVRSGLVRPSQALREVAEALAAQLSAQQVRERERDARARPSLGLAGLAV